MMKYVTFVADAYDEVVLPESTEEEFQTFLKFTIGWTLLFISVHLLVLSAQKTEFIVALCKDVDSKKQAELPGYIVSLIHHLGIAPICLYRICGDFIEFSGNNGAAFPKDHYNSLYSPSGLYPFTLGYFIADSFVFAIPEAFKPGLSSKIFLVHHAVAMSMIYGTYTLTNGSLTQVFPGMMCTEFSTIFFNVAWILRAFGLRDWMMVSIFEKLFAFFFLFLRNCHLTLLIYVLWYDIAGFGHYQICILISTALQFFWASKIIMSLFASKRKKKNV